MINQCPKAVCSLIIDDRGLILAASRKNDFSVFGLPGGKVDYNDKDLVSAAQRELLEETGLSAFGGVPVFTSMCYGEDGKHYMTTTFMWRSFTSTPKQIEGEGLVAWVSPDVLCRTNTGKHKNFGFYNQSLFEKMNIFVMGVRNPNIGPYTTIYMIENSKSNQVIKV